jgi:hypothetical protein
MATMSEPQARMPATDGSAAAPPTWDRQRDDYLDSRVREMLAAGEAASREILEAEHALRELHERSRQANDGELQGELALRALEHVEYELELVRKRRQGLDGLESRLWGRRNRLERELIAARGPAWWRARRAHAAGAHTSL